MNINGFEIEKYNQYNLQENVKYSTCPLCSSSRKKNTQKCLTIFWNKGLASCSHCGEMLQLHTFKKKNTEKIYKKPKWKNNTKLSENVVKWFESRKISQFTLRQMKISEGKEWMPQTKKEENTIQFNYFQNSELINIKYRDGRKNFKLSKDAEKIFYNIDNIRLSDECIIVEGEIDCLSFIESGFFNCVSTPNGSTLHNVNLDYLDSSYEYFENKNKIYLGLDNDKAGQNVQNELIRRLGAEKCYLLDFADCNDANEFLQKYNKEKLKEVVLNAKPVPLENVTTANDYLNELDNYYKNGLQKGYLTGIHNLDLKFSVYLGQFISVTGIPTHGKTTFVDSMAVGYCIRNDWKGVFCSPENEPKVLHIDSLVRKIAGYKPKDYNNTQNNTWQNAVQKVNDYFYHVVFKDGYDLLKVLNKIKELIKRKGIKYFVLDPYNKIRLKEALNKNINDYTNDYLHTIDTFCRENQVLGIIVAHPIKMHKQNGIVPEPSFYDIKGGGEWYDMSPHGLSIYRDFNRNFTKVKVLKCKFQNLGENGAEMYYKFSPLNSRYLPVYESPDQLENLTPKFDYSSYLNDKNEHETNSDIEPEFNNLVETEEMPF